MNIINVAEAASSNSITDLSSFIKFLSDILVKGIIPLLVGLAVAAFIYGIIQYFLNPDNEEKKKAGKSYLLWGIISLFIMVSFWGIVNILKNTFTDDAGYKVQMPQIPESE